MIIGGAVGGAAALAVIALLFWLWRRRVNKKKELGQPRTPVSERSGGGGRPLSGGAAATRPFAAGRQASTRVQGWWASHGVGHGAPLITPEYGEKQPAVVQPVPARARRASLEQRALQDPFSDAHGSEARNVAAAATTAITPLQQQQQQQRLRGILKQPAPSLHSSHPSDASSIVAAAAARRSRAHSASGQQRASQRILASRRTSSLTNDPFEDRRTKFRSDPFDLELDTRMLSSSSSSSSFSVPQRDPRASSVYSARTGTSSRYTSGMSSAWGGGTEPAATVAPLAVGGGRSGVNDSPTLPQEPRRGGGFGGGGIVGQAI